MSQASSSESIVYDDDSQQPAVVDERAALRAHLRTYRIYKPPFVLALFVAMNFWTYYDRGAMSTSVATIRADPSISGGSTPVSETNSGLLVSIFMVGYLLSSPLFTGLGGILPAKTIILIGLIVWCAACLATGLVRGFYPLLVVRAFVGIGEAAYCGYTITIVDNMAPPPLRTLWIGIFYAMVPVGTAVGMIAGGVMSSDGSTSAIAGWRLTFITEIVPMAFVVAATALMPSAYNPVRQSGLKKRASLEDHTEEQDDASHTLNSSEPPVDRAVDDFVPILTALRRLVVNVDYVCLLVGYGTYTFVLGGIAVWAVSFMAYGPLHTSTVTASLFLGGTVALGGMFGTLLGGMAVDKMGGSQGYQGIYKCSVFNTVMIVISLPLGLLALSTRSFAVFSVPFLLSVFFLFAVTAPVNSAILSSVPRNIRTYAVTFSITVIHLIGDVPSPVFAGYVADRFDGGCSQWNSNQTLCEGYTVSPCVWVPKQSHSEPYCTNEYQLRNALFIVFAIMFIAIPVWAVVAIRMRHRRGDADHPVLDDPSLGPLIGPPGMKPLRDVE